MRVFLFLLMMMFSLPAMATKDYLGSCSELGEKACNIAGNCVLEQSEDKTYRCRSPQNECEENWNKQRSPKESCEATAGCVFVPASCYCPPDVVCICGGGNPPACKKKQE